MSKFTEFSNKLNELWANSPKEPYFCPCGKGKEYEYFFSMHQMAVRIRPKGEIGTISFRCMACEEVLPQYGEKS